MEAVRVRALQTELMVAALSCNARGDYNRFVNRFKPDLKENADALKSYFTRVYGASGEKEMNRFITKLANDVSKRSAKQGTRRFCGDAEEVMDEVGSSRSLSAISYDYRGTIRGCRGGKTPKPSIARPLKPQEQTEEKPTLTLRSLWPF